jgi:hypothetical protein
MQEFGCIAWPTVAIQEKAKLKNGGARENLQK